MIHHYKNTKAFTLAEVLITLGIIGIVASMTMPSIITNYQKKVTIAQLKKAYSVVSQALVSSQAENGTIEEWNLSNIAQMNPEDPNGSYKETLTAVLDRYFLPYLDIVEDCGLYCAQQKNIKRYELNRINEVSWSDKFHYVITLKDGSIIAFMMDSSGAGVYQYIYINVDINGNSKPNVYGRDIFTFMLTSATKKLNMAGDGYSRETLMSSSRRGCNKNSTSDAGFYCGALIQYDGWEIKNDYPW